jgi:hypothetical protein
MEADLSEDEPDRPGSEIPVDEPDEVWWRGRQWCVTQYGLETRGRPYLYSLSVQQIAEVRSTQDGIVANTVIHLMEKNWLDVDDLFTAWLVSISLHGLNVAFVDVQRTFRHALAQRRDLYGYRPGALPESDMKSGVMSLHEMGKYQPEPVWHGSQNLGEPLGGIGPIRERDHDPED